MSAADEYSRRLQDRLARVAEHEQRHILLGNIRLGLFLTAAAMAWLAFARHVFSPWWLSLPFITFVLLAGYHSRVLRSRTFAERAVRFYRDGLARIADQWIGTGQTGERFQDPHHVYSADLDIFGRGSLFQLLSTCRTRIGENTLAAWLLTPSSADEVRQRQTAVSDLRSQLDLREDLAVLGEDAGVGGRPEALLKWSASPPDVQQQWLRPVAFLLAACAIASALLWAVWDHAFPFVVVIGIEGILIYRLRHRLDRVLHSTENAFDSLGLLSAVLERLERASFSAPLLQHLSAQVASHQVPGSRALKRLRKIVDLSMSRDNVFVRVLDVPLMYSVQVAISAENWRRNHGAAVPRWLGAVGEIEALLSMSSFAYEHTADSFPQLVTGPASFEAEALGHPLLPAATCVRNDVSISGATRVLLVSGSNMSGKSTLLRAIGINTVLAMAGAPVRAHNLRLTPLQVGASIRVNDSLQDGSSRFYAEITRLRAVYDLAGRDPQLLFLIDELLQGTNSSDRQIGAEGILRALVERGAIGLVTTHDLALTHINPPLHQHIRNVHFQDELEDGKIRFDYRLREGIVTKSNGLALMRSIGLDV